eukprot:4579672-Pleurochrysis_carterae.AAC.1
MRMKRALHIANPCGKWRRTSAARASPRPRALSLSLTARYAPLMRTYVDGCDAVITIIAITMYVVEGYSFMKRLASLVYPVDLS